PLQSRSQQQFLFLSHVLLISASDHCLPYHEYWSTIRNGSVHSNGHPYPCSHLIRELTQMRARFRSAYHKYSKFLNSVSDGWSLLPQWLPDWSNLTSRRLENIFPCN